MAERLFSAGLLTEEESFFCAHLSDLIRQAQGGRLRFTNFLNLREQQIAEVLLESRKVENYAFYGGFPDAERKMLCISGSVLPQPEQFPIRFLSVTYWQQSGAAALSHRDFLGSLMNLNLKRELIGDILTQEGEATVICTASAAKTLLEEWNKVGRTAVQVSETEAVATIFAPAFEVLEGTVASLRLDAVLSMALRISREKAADLIRARLVQRNHSLCQELSQEILEGDRISVRGYGKYRVEQIRGTSRKGRTFLTVHHYL